MTEEEKNKADKYVLLTLPLKDGICCGTCDNTVDYYYCAFWGQNIAEPLDFYCKKWEMKSDE